MLHQRVDDGLDVRAALGVKRASAEGVSERNDVRFSGERQLARQTCGLSMQFVIDSWW